MQNVVFWFLFVFQLPVACGGAHFLHIPYVALCWFLVHEYVALHRKIYFYHVPAPVFPLILLSQTR